LAVEIAGKPNNSAETIALIEKIAKEIQYGERSEYGENC